MASSARAVVIGGGIGGLTAGAALHRRGWEVTVLERAPSLAPVGAAISLAPNALRALDVLGIGDEIRELAAWQGDGGLRTPSGRWLSRSDAAAATARFGDPLVLLPRATLIDRLAALLPPGGVRTGTVATVVDPGDGGRPARVRCGPADAGDPTAHEEREAELVVGADGINSRVRTALFPEHPGPVYAGFTTWRVLIPLPGVAFASHETWGRGRLWGTHPLHDGRVYAYAAAVTPAGGRAPDDERAELLRRYGDWHHPVPAVLAATRPEDVLRHDVHHLATPPRAYHAGRVALLGDAAHAMPPTLGQGGNQAVEDAVVLAHHARDLAAYTAARLPRTTAIARQAVRIARVNMAGGRAAVAVRDTAMAALSRLGPALFLRGFDGIADWRPPYAAGDVQLGEPQGRDT
ncbi:NAD(P)-binding protein [Streptomyces sp. SID4946]|uniref:FAD-dependent monooxygenase n=1 Tax=Streptomyces TaxID=1883 RepID=UPI00081D4CE7|nr:MULTISPECIES: FAD-dependent monooxygenase [unclassified Streptomyces]MBJ6999827.1 FAD-dependent monooxygenase [Streptomyces sp. CRPSP2-6A1]MYQ95745.1 NAD(P)-binding protein [Streptomyces sp. SID4946]SCF97339.1 2-polyprenyl-6-methoxyphenol hydroxylase [Streptomyces sp. DconLS]SCG02123.1 2-polyprenyl-6-methoxyphenol hydroxylase [Streptomyces sp. LamerLS-31b]